MNDNAPPGSAGPAASANEPLLDIERASALLEKPQHVRHMLKLLVATVPRDLRQIDDSLASGERDKACSVLHQLKGFLPMFCTEALGHELQTVTRLCRQADEVDFDREFPAVRTKIDRLCEQARDYLKTQRS